MNYQSPIELIQTQMEGQLIDTIYEAVMNVGVNVDKEELLKALAYDRDQYQKGYADREQEIIRCKDCKFCEYPKSEREWCKKGHLHGNAETWFCADVERRGEQDG